MSRDKRPVAEDETSDTESVASSASSASSASAVDVCFELFNMAEGDYHSVKQYLGNLFGLRGHEVDLTALSSLIVEDLADHVGTCMKTDGESGDPFGFATGFTLAMARKAAGSRITSSLGAFLKSKSKGASELEDFFKADENVVLFSERLINVPAELAAPLYRQFLDDWEHACAEEPEHFTEAGKMLLLTPCYREVASRLDRELGVGREKEKGKRAKGSSFESTSAKTEYYYEELGLLESEGLAETVIDFTVDTGHETADSRRAFGDVGIEPGRRGFVVSWMNFRRFVELCAEKQ